jgi:osmotically-inducible protein OsmY
MRWLVRFLFGMAFVPAVLAEKRPGSDAGGAIGMRIQGETAVLEGVAVSLDEAEREAARAAALPGVKGVVNQIRILPGGSDAVLGKQARAALRDQKWIEAGRVRVVVRNGRAVLNGEIGSLDENDLARELVSRVAGIREIENQLDVTFDSIRSDAQIGAQIEFMVADDPLYEGAEISAQVVDGIVRLSGTIGSRSLWERLVGQSYVTGVFAVEAHEVAVRSATGGEAVAAHEP